jgi:outer membrane protein assembly factor BamB
MLAGVTPTAGGLVFAADLGGQIYAMDADKGSILWQSNVGQATGGGIVTYRAGGRQLIGVASNEITDVAGRRPVEPNSRVRFALTVARTPRR